MITLNLVQHHKNAPCKSWAFQGKSVVRVGRSPDNDVVVHSAVVSRHHLELHHITDDYWKIVNIGTNGTYDDLSRPIVQAPVIDGMIVRLARSGPKIQIHKGAIVNAFEQDRDDDTLTEEEILISQSV